MGSQNLAAQFEAGVNMMVAAICLVIFVVSMICESAQALKKCAPASNGAILGVKCKDKNRAELLCECPTSKPNSVCRQWMSGHSYCQAKSKLKLGQKCGNRRGVCKKGLVCKGGVNSIGVRICQTEE